MGVAAPPDLLLGSSRDADLLVILGLCNGKGN